MAKTKNFYQCRDCGFESPQWLGKCSSCGAWNSLEEKVQERPAASLQTTAEIPALSEKDRTRLAGLNRYAAQDSKRLLTGIQEFDRVMGGGLFEGSVALLSGEPGIGKSTLLVQVAERFSRHGLVLYISAEESLPQVTARAKRLGLSSESLVVLAENNLVTILSFLRESKPILVIIDSIQAIYHPDLTQTSGSMGQVRESAALLEAAAREAGTTLLLVGHVTKEGFLAGPKTLEHLVDTVVYFEGDRYQNLRILRAVKNRNGSTGEIGLFEMSEKGLEEVKNPSALFMGESTNAPGRALTVLLEGERPLIVEIQALVSPSVYANPTRRFQGVDMNQASLLLAILEKNLKLSFSKNDLFLKVSGGLTVDETASDLALSLAMVSSFLGKVIPPQTAFIGEVGLGGEVRPVRALETRIRECERLGLKTLLVPKQKRKASPSSIKILEVNSLQEAYQVSIL